MSPIPDLSELPETKPMPKTIHGLIRGPGIFAAENCLIRPQWERRCLTLWKLDAPGKREAGRGEVDRSGSTLSEAGEEGIGRVECK